MLQVNAPKSSRTWFMTGLSAPNAINMVANGNYSAFSLVHEQKPSGRDCPGLSIITADGWILSVGKPKKVQNLQVSSASSLIKCYQITHAVFMSLLHTVTVVSCPLLRQKRYSRGKSTVGDCRRNPMWPKIRYMRDRCNRVSYCDKA
jgi:hypothetical protein